MWQQGVIYNYFSHFRLLGCPKLVDWLGFYYIICVDKTTQRIFSGLDWFTQFGPLLIVKLVNR